MDTLHPKYPYPRTKVQLFNSITSLRDEYFDLISKSKYKSIFLHSVLESFATNYGSDWSKLTALAQLAIHEKYKEFLEYKETPSHPIFNKIYAWEFLAESLGPLPKPDEVEEVLNACPSEACPSYFHLYSWLENNREAA